MASQPRCPKCTGYGATYRTYRRYAADEGKKGYKPIGYHCNPKYRTNSWGPTRGAHGCGHLWLDDDPTKGGVIEIEVKVPPEPRASLGPRMSDHQAVVAEATVDDPSPPPDEDDEWASTPQAAIQGDAGQAPENDDQESPAMVNLGRQEDQ